MLDCGPSGQGTQEAIGVAAEESGERTYDDSTL
jgi:hypothetical protein